MSNESNDWGESAQDSELSLKSLPKDWTGFTRAQKIEKQTAVIQHQMVRVRRGAFNTVDAPRVAAMVLDTQMEMAEFIADAEAAALRAKHLSDFIEADKITKIGKEFVAEGKKVSETALKRMATVSDEVKESKEAMVEAGQEYKKWRDIHSMLASAHVFFRNFGKA